MKLSKGAADLAYKRKRYLLYSFQRRYALTFIACSIPITAAIAFLVCHLMRNNLDEGEGFESNLTKWLITATAIFVLAASGILYLLIVRASHRLAGPIALMTRYLSQLSSGKLPSMRALRKQDELKDFFSLFRDTVDKFRKEYESDSRVLQEAIGALSTDTSSGGREEAIRQLKTMLELRQERLGPPTSNA